MLGLRLAGRRRLRANGRETCASPGAPLGDAHARKTRVKQKTERSDPCPTIIPCTPGTAPQRFESLFIAGNCEKGHRVPVPRLEGVIGDLRESAKERVITTGGLQSPPSSAKSTATKTTISLYSTVVSPRGFAPGQDRCLEKYQHLSRGAGLSRCKAATTQALVTRTAGKPGRRKRGRCACGTGVCFPALLTRASLYGYALSFSWLRKLPD